MVRIVAAIVTSSQLVAAKDDLILLQTRSFSTLEAAAEGQAIASMTASMKDILLATPRDADVMKRDDHAVTTFVSSMQDQVKIMKDALVAQNAEDTKAIADLEGEFTACNTAKATGWSSVEAHWTTVGNAKDTHTNCRAAEVTAVNDETQKCGDKVALSDQYKGAMELCLGAAGDAEAVKGCLATACEDHGNGNQATLLQAKIDQCDSATDALDEKHTECNGAQTTLEAAFCAAATANDDICDTQDECYTTASNVYEQRKTDWSAKLESQNAMWTSILHIECLFGLFNKEETSDQVKEVTSSQVDTCLRAVHQNKFELDFEATPLDKFPKEACSRAQTEWDSATYYGGVKGVVGRLTTTKGVDPESTEDIQVIAQCAKDRVTPATVVDAP